MLSYFVISFSFFSTIRDEQGVLYPRTVTHLSANPARRRESSLMRSTMLRAAIRQAASNWQLSGVPGVTA